MEKVLQEVILIHIFSSLHLWSFSSFLSFFNLSLDFELYSACLFFVIFLS